MKFRPEKHHTKAELDLMIRDTSHCIYTLRRVLTIRLRPLTKDRPLIMAKIKRCEDFLNRMRDLRSKL